MPEGWVTLRPGTKRSLRSFAVREGVKTMRKATICHKMCKHLLKGTQTYIDASFLEEMAHP